MPLKSSFYFTLKLNEPPTRPDTKTDEVWSNSWMNYPCTQIVQLEIGDKMRNMNYLMAYDLNFADAFLMQTVPTGVHSNSQLMLLQGYAQIRF